MGLQGFDGLVLTRVKGRARDDKDGMWAYTEKDGSYACLLP